MRAQTTRAAGVQVPHVMAMILCPRSTTGAVGSIVGDAVARLGAGCVRFGQCTSDHSSRAPRRGYIGIADKAGRARRIGSLVIKRVEHRNKREGLLIMRAWLSPSVEAPSMRKPLCRTRAFGSLASTDLARPEPRVVDQWTRRLRAEISDLIADLRVCQPALDARLQAE